MRSNKKKVGLKENIDNNKEGPIHLIRRQNILTNTNNDHIQ